MTQVQILFLAANPHDQNQLGLDREVKAIYTALRQADFRDNFNLEQEWAVRFNDLQGSLLRYKPNIVHFSGHGSERSEIILEDETGGSHQVPNKALSQLFYVFKDTVQCVVLNACYSEQQAKAISEHIDFVVGMKQAIGDQAAINFASSFYQALAYGKNVKAAFFLGCNQIDLASLNEEDTPQLIVKPGSDPEKVFFVKKEESVPKKQEAPIKPVPKPTKQEKVEEPQDEPSIPSFNKPMITKTKPNLIAEAAEKAQQGFLLIMQGRMNDAIREFDQALKFDSKFADAWSGKGIALFNLTIMTPNVNLLNQALECFDKALRVNPQHAMAWTYKGSTLINLNLLTPNATRNNEALACFNTALNINVNIPEAWVGKGTCLLNMNLAAPNANQLYEAINCFDTALRINPQYADAWNKKAVAQNALMQLNVYRSANPWFG